MLPNVLNAGRPKTSGRVKTMTSETKAMFDHSPATRAVMAILARVARHKWKGLTMLTTELFLAGRHAPSPVRAAFRRLALVGLIVWRGGRVRLAGGKYAKVCSLR